MNYTDSSPENPVAVKCTYPFEIAVGILILQIYMSKYNRGVRSLQRVIDHKTNMHLLHRLLR